MVQSQSHSKLMVEMRPNTEGVNISMVKIVKTGH
ncbi:hypothetical protein E2C01_095882 [Portunus trituberculatus]|uniref:Uncharacterized protein n=1 Tax=Portunus trituberculatus TaxID=210409 RepID=A0A5B7JWH9_PORTR|nr:hypothetical protein [Portunus trituberculatus]